VSEPFTPQPEAAAPGEAHGRSLLELGGLVTLACMAIAAVVGVIAVLDAGSRSEGFGVGFGIAALVFLVGATVACALACLARRRMEIVSVAVLTAACLALDLLVLAIWLDIDNDAYAKLVGVGFVWTFFGLLALGLTLAVGRPERLALALYTGALASAVAGGLIGTVLVLRAGGDVSAGVAEFGAVPIDDDALLQLLGAMLVLLAAFWFGALAASRLPDQTLKRTFTTSPSSTT
jgi:hypothetical protein